ATSLTAVMVKRADDAGAIAAFLADRRYRASVIGPGAGVGPATRARAQACLAADGACVLDADALTSFEQDPDALFRRLHVRDVLTPHAGEFARLFPDLDPAGPDGKVAAALTAAARAGCVVVLKGPDTVVAAPDGRAVVNANAPPDLATAGAGDVLAGLIAGFAAQDPGASFSAACAGVWVHGACGAAIGPGLIADDLPGAVPGVLKSLRSLDLSA
ncbi:MAG: ADP/ATP-dependent (S)-NAD(P)H-hydrate dehydratase, partial [Pseudomonadota bacterium]